MNIESNPQIETHSPPMHHHTTTTSQLSSTPTPFSASELPQQHHVSSSSPKISQPPNVEIMAWIDNLHNSYSHKNKGHRRMSMTGHKAILEQSVENLGNMGNVESTLEEQLQMLSKSYKRAQQNLLSLQKQLYYECIHNEKQRSIIEILKYIINDNLDDETILTYLSAMQEDSTSSPSTSTGSPSKKQEIKADLEEIRDMILKKRKNNLKKSPKDPNAAIIADLKKELTNSNRIKKELMEDLDTVLNQKGMLEAMLEETKAQEEEREEARVRDAKEMEILRCVNDNLEKEKRELKGVISELERDAEGREMVMRKNWEELRVILGKNNSDDKESPSSPLSQNFCQLVKKVGKKIQRYREHSLDQTHKLQQYQSNNHLISILKLFLPQEALTIFSQFQRTPHECLLHELEAYCKMEKERVSKLEACQEQMWQMRVRALRGDEGSSKQNDGMSGNMRNGLLGEKKFDCI